MIDPTKFLVQTTRRPGRTEIIVRHTMTRGTTLTGSQGARAVEQQVERLSRELWRDIFGDLEAQAAKVRIELLREPSTPALDSLDALISKLKYPT